MKMKKLCSVIVGIFLTTGLIIGLCPMIKTYAYTEVEVTNGGSIIGTVVFDGDVPKARMFKVDKDTESCRQGEVPSEALIISEDSKGIKNVIVSIEHIEKGKKFESQDSNQVLDQNQCVFVPHILAVPAGATVDILNSDDVLHNVHSYAIRNEAFNEGVTAGGRLSKKFDVPEVVSIRCDLHPWMSSFIVTKRNPYFTVTDESGNFRIDNVPAGTYKLQAWQEKLGKQLQDVTVEAGKDVQVDFALQAKKRRKRSE
jgi:plastocyanin